MECATLKVLIQVLNWVLILVFGMYYIKLLKRVLNNWNVKHYVSKNNCPIDYKIKSCDKHDQ